MSELVARSEAERSAATAPSEAERPSSGTSPRAADRHEQLDYADRWLADSFRVIQGSPPGYSVTLDVDMSPTRGLIDRMRLAGVRGSYAGVLLRAAALALVRHPELHQIVLGTRRVRPGQVDIALSVANEAFAAPLLRLDDVGRKELPALAEELRVRVPAIRVEDSRILGQLRRWGWLLPTGWLRRLVLRLMFGSLRMRRHLAGSLQVSVVPGVDVVLPYLCTAPAVLSMGRVAERVVARDGQPVVRLTATLTCTADHKIWDGQRVATFLSTVAAILESGELRSELPAPDQGLPLEVPAVEAPLSQEPPVPWAAREVASGPGAQGRTLG